MNNLIYLSEELLAFLKKNHYKQSTLAKYRRELNVLRRFCESHGSEEYTLELGNEYAADIYINGHFSAHRYFDRGRLTRFLNFYLEHGYFDLSIKKGKKYDDDIIRFQGEYEAYKNYIYDRNIKESTKHNYSYYAYVFLRFLSDNKLYEIDDLSVELIYNFLMTFKPKRQRYVIGGVRSYLKFIKRNDLLQQISGLRLPRIKKIIPTLSNDEHNRIQAVLNSDLVTYRDKSIFLLGYILGIRACDIVTLKLSDIDWYNDCIHFIQSKTGNQVSVPLYTEIGNSLYLYITQEREKSDYENIFVSHLPPFKPLADHSACYTIVNKFMNKADVTKDDRFFGIHFLRHNTASALVHKGVSLETISSILGHSDPNSTSVYISTDSERLKECVLSMKDIGIGGEIDD